MTLKKIFIAFYGTYAEEYGGQSGSKQKLYSLFFEDSG